jgi:uncharacterized protein
MQRNLPALCLCVLLAISRFGWAEAQASDQVIGILVGDAEWMPQAAELAKNLAHEDGLRVLPIMGAGGVQALRDLSQLSNVDAALVSSDSLVYAQQQKLLTGKILYVARLAPLEVVLVARQGLNNITALAGKRIATGPAESSGFATGELLFGALEVPFLRVPAQGENAIAALLAGKADAALVLGTQIAKSALADPRFHVVSLPLPPQLAQIYQAAELTTKSETIETISTSLTLAVFDWPRNSARYNILKRFETQLYKLPQASSFAVDVNGWTRHASATDVLKKSSIASNAPPTILPTGDTP